jgi:hypothetical protein
LALNQKVILFYYENWSENCGWKIHFLSNKLRGP